MLQIVIICAITGDLDNICTGIDSIPLHMLSKSPGVNPPSTIPNPIPIEFLIPNPIPVNLSMIPNPIRFQ